MSENIIDELISDSNYKTYNSDYILSQCPHQDNDSTSSFLNLIDQDIINNQMMGDSYSPNYSISESTNNSSAEQPAKPDVKSSGVDQNFEEMLLSKLPQIIAIERASIQYQVIDQIYPSLSKSFQNCFNSPVLDLLVVVLDPNKLVSFYQGYFAGIPRLTNELINLTGKYWKSLISNNDDNAWESHFRSVYEKNSSKTNYEPEFEAGPVIRCRLRASSSSQFNQQYNYFFVQPCSYIIQLPVHFNNKSMEFSAMDTAAGGINNYLVSYINIVRECDTEYALKGSAAASLQKVITNSTFIQRQKLDNILETPTNKQANSRTFQRNIHNTPVAINNQLSVNISSPAYPNMEQTTIAASAPLTYPLINNQRSEQYSKTNLFGNAQIQHQMSQQRQSSIPMNHSQFMSRGSSMPTVDPNQHRYSGHYDNSHSSLQYILENRNNGYPSVKQQHSNHSHLMGQHGQIYKNPIQSNHAYFLPAAQSAQQTCSLNSPTSFMPARHVIQMPSNSILMSSDQYFRNSHQINLMDSVQVAQPMMTVVQPMSVSSNHSPANYYYSTAQNQILHNPLHINTSLTNQSQFVSSSVSPYCNADRASMPHQDYSSGSSSRTVSQSAIKQENYDISICQNDWLSNPVLDSRNSSLMSNNSISIDIVEEILQAEEAKSENKSLDNDLNKSDSSDSLMGYLNDFMSNAKTSSSAGSNINEIAISAPNVQAASSPQLVTLNPIKAEGKISEFKTNNISSCKSHNSPKVNPQLNLKMEILKNLDSTQRLQIKKIVNQFKMGKLMKIQMYEQINQFLTQALGSQTYSQQVIKFWKTHQHCPLTDNVDSTLSGFNYSHVVQSPEEGPGISPTEQAAQSTTDLEEDKELIKHSHKTKHKDKAANESTKKHGRSKAHSKNSEASIYSITSTTPTGVLETLLNEHDNPMISDKCLKSMSINSTSKLSISSTSKNQLSLDQLLLDEDFSICPNNDDRLHKKSSDPLSGRSAGTKPVKSQPSTPLVANNMGVLETLLNQKTPSMFTLRQMSTENILKHSKPSRQNSSDMFVDESNNSFDSIDKDKGLKKNSLLITLLNTSQNPEKAKALNSSSSFDGSSPSFPNKRCRMLSGTQTSFDPKKMDDKLVSNGLDVFDFVDTELSYGTTDTQSTVVTSSQALNARKPSQTKKGRKRRYSKDRSIDSDGSSDRLSSIGDKYMKTSTLSVKSEDKNVILTSLLENVKPRDIMTAVSSGKVALGVGKSEPSEYEQPTVVFDNQMVADDNIDLEDIKIDDFDLENLIDISENYDESTPAIMGAVEPAMGAIIHKTNNSDSSLLTNKIIMTNSTMPAGATFDVVPPVYKMVGPIIKSDPIVPMSKQSILRMSDKNSFLLSAIQSTPTSNSISVECLDSERERLLRQQQQQKLCMGGDKPPVTMGHQLSLDMLSKQMKEVGPNVMVELSVPSDVPRSRKGSISRSQSTISTQPTSCNSASTMSTSPTCRSSFQPNCPMDMVTDGTRVVTTSVNQVNHQQVRDGLRLLVTNRSAQNSSKNNLQMHRNNSAGINEMLPQSEISAATKSAVKDVIHYPSSIAPPPSNCHKDPSYPYSNQSYSAAISNTNDANTADILEDSLVNDVFGLEELVNSKSRHSSASMEYSKLNLPETATVDHPHQTDSLGFVSSVGVAPQPTANTVASAGNNTYSRPPASVPTPQPHHHHHYTHHYHHQHHHHHHHNAPSSSSSNPPSVNESNVSTTKDKPSVSSGLLETLLSR